MGKTMKEIAEMINSIREEQASENEYVEDDFDDEDENIIDMIAGLFDVDDDCDCEEDCDCEDDYDCDYGCEDDEFEEIDTVTLVDDDGYEVGFEIIFDCDIKGNNYMILENDEEELYIVQYYETGDEEFEFELVEDERILKKVLKKYEKSLDED